MTGVDGKSRFGGIFQETIPGGKSQDVTFTLHFRDTATAARIEIERVKIGKSEWQSEDGTTEAIRVRSND